MINVLDVTETGRPNTWQWAKVNGTLVKIFRNSVETTMKFKLNRSLTIALISALTRPMHSVVLGPCRTSIVSALEKH